MRIFGIYIGKIAATDAEIKALNDGTAHVHKNPPRRKKGEKEKMPPTNASDSAESPEGGKEV